MPNSNQIRTAHVILDWIDSLDGTEPVEEIAAGVRDIEDLFPALDIRFEDPNEVGQELIHDNASLLSGWEDPKYVVARMQAIAARIREAIYVPPTD